MLALKRNITFLLNLPNDFYNWFALKYRKVQYSEYPTIQGKIYLSGWGEFIFGKRISINSCRSANPIGGDIRTVIVVYKGGILKIGNDVGLSNVTINCKKEVIIGDHVKIGGGVKIYDSDFHALDFSKRKLRETDNPVMKSIQLKDGCFIGAHSIILKGVTIGKESIIGAGSVVTKSIPDGEIWGGNPAKLIRKI